MRRIASERDYILDPHGAVGYLGLKKYAEGRAVQGIFLETAHPAKFREVVEEALGREVEVPQPLQEFMGREKRSVSISSGFDAFKTFLRDIL